MSWQIRVVPWDAPEKQIGDAWYIPESQIKLGVDGRRHWFGYTLTDDYEQNKRSQRQPIAVVLPSAYGGLDFCIDSEFTNSRGGWQISGDLPNLTLSPSVNLGGIYHGWIQNGIISDDCEGRKFP